MAYQQINYIISKEINREELLLLNFDINEELKNKKLFDINYFSIKLKY